MYLKSILENNTFSFERIRNKTILYLLVFFILLSISYIQNKLKPEYIFFRSIYFKLILCTLIIMFSKNNIQLSLSLAIVLSILSISQINEPFISENRNKTLIDIM